MHRTMNGLRHRVVRATVQVAAVGLLVGSVALAASGDRWSTVVVAAMVTVSIKLSLVALQTADSRTVSISNDLSRATSEFRTRSARADSDTEQLRQSIDEVRRSISALSASVSAVQAITDELSARQVGLEATLSPDQDEFRNIRLEVAPALAAVTSISSRLMAMADQLDRLERRWSRND